MMEPLKWPLWSRRVFLVTLPMMFPVYLTLWVILATIAIAAIMAEDVLRWSVKMWKER